YRKLTFSEESNNAQWSNPTPLQNASLDSPDPTIRNIAALETVLPVFRCPAANIPLHVLDASSWSPPWFVLKRVPGTYLGCASGTAKTDWRPPPNGSGIPLWAQNGIFITRQPRADDSEWTFFKKGLVRIKVADVSDGLSSTIAIGEALPNPKIDIT